MFFDIINVEYTCVLIKDDIAIIEVDMNSSSSDKLSSEMKLTRSYKGEYTVNIKDGTVTNAKLHINMFSGFSQLKGTIEIISI